MPAQRSDMERIKLTSNLAQLLFERFEITGSPEDLAVAEEVGNLMLKLIPETSLDHPDMYDWLGSTSVVQLRFGIARRSKQHLNHAVNLTERLLRIHLRGYCCWE